MLIGLLLVATASPLRADDAPMQQTTTGLSPGMPGTTVRMAAEKVDINVGERDGAVHAMVNASFDMFNRGPSVNMTVGFPKFNANFFVAYDQTISAHHDGSGYVYISYVLRTGGLWDGTIGDATITMTSTSGGGFLLPSADELKNQAQAQQQDAQPQSQLPTSSATNQVSWHLTDFKPTFDPYVIYVPGDKWQRLTAAEARLAAPSPAADDYAAAVEAFFDSIGRTVGGLPGIYRPAPPQALTSQYDQVRAWANQAVQLDPNDPAAVEALGDMQYVSEVRASLYIACRPDVSPVTYQKAVDLGSTTAQAKLDGIKLQVTTGIDVRNGLLSCSTDPNNPGSEAAPDTLTDDVRSEILTAIDRANSAWKDATYTLTPSRLDGQVAGQELANDQAELESLLRARQRHGNENSSFDVLDVTLDAPGHAIVHTRETWSTKVYAMATGQVTQEIPPMVYNNTYTVEFQNGGWIVTRNDT